MVSSAAWKRVSLVAGVLLCFVHPRFDVRAEFFSSTEEMRQLIKHEESLIVSLDNYIKMHQIKIEFLSQQRDKLAEELREAQKDEILYVSNPITAFLITERLVSEWEQIRTFMDMDVGVKLQNISKAPTEEDVLGIVDGLVRLQDIYEFDVKDMASGNMFGQKLNRQLTPAECFEIGRKLLENSNTVHAISWLREALRSWPKENPDVSKVGLMNSLSDALSKEGEYEEALEITKNVLNIQPDNEIALKSKDTLEVGITYKKEFPLPAKPPTLDLGIYPSLCRGEFKGRNKLRCYFEHKRSPFLRIAPMKVEEVNREPFVVLYHELLTDKEIDQMITLSKPSLTRFMADDEDKQKVSKMRISNNVWLTDDMHPIVRTFSQRAEDVSGLSMAAAEALRVSNYGIGGHYMPHYDYFSPKEYEAYDPITGTGNRIATLMLYLSNVEIGGATVFPDLGVGVFPRKGSALFWYNLHANGSPDTRSIHAACPVFVGSKWVGIKWIHEYGQEYRRPCQLDRNV